MRLPESLGTGRSTLGVTVVGLGATGCALAAFLSLRGYHVTLYGRNPSRVDTILTQGGIRITGDLGELVVPLLLVTSDLDFAMRERLILVSIRQNGQRALAKAMGPRIREDHTVLLLSGGAGCLETVHVWRTHGIGIQCCLGETSAPAHSSRLLEDGTVVVRVSPRRRTLRVAAFPAHENGRLLENIDGFFSVRPGKHVLEVALCNANVVLHPLPMLLNLGAIERRRGQFALMAEGMTSGVLRVVDAHDEERMRLLTAVGADPVPVDALFEELGLDPQEYRESRPAPKFFDQIEERFLTEDIPCGTAFMASLGRLLGISTPVSDAILQLASCLRGESFVTTGRTCKRLGIAGLNKDQLSNYLLHGSAPSLEPAASGRA